MNMDKILDTIVCNNCGRKIKIVTGEKIHFFMEGEWKEINPLMYFESIAKTYTTYRCCDNPDYNYKDE